jgi:hypothetical protein
MSYHPGWLSLFVKNNIEEKQKFLFEKLKELDGLPLCQDGTNVNLLLEISPEKTADIKVVDENGYEWYRRIIGNFSFHPPTGKYALFFRRSSFFNYFQMEVFYENSLDRLMEIYCNALSEYGFRARLE